jgi:hypothetical protein
MNDALGKKAPMTRELLQAIRGSFEQIKDPRCRPGSISLADALMSAVAMFALKFPSLLKFDEHRNEAVIRANLRALYGVEQAPCDSEMRELLDGVDAERLTGAFTEVHRYLRQEGLLQDYRFLGGYLVSMDGTEPFESAKIHCAQCCERTLKNGEVRYYHQGLTAAIVHPAHRQVFALPAEPIVRQDGKQKNDCERSALKRLLKKVRTVYPLRGPKLIAVLDGLYGDGETLKALKALGFSYIIVVKEGDHAALFEAVHAALQAGKTDEFEYQDAQGVLHGFRYLNGVPLNKSHPDLLVNYLDYWEIGKDGKEYHCIWITDIPLSRETVEPVMKGGRARWKIENETFNTLKNQGYAFEHNYGHGQKSLATVLMQLMLLAFLVDQVQEYGCAWFKAARRRFRSRTSLWECLRALFCYYLVESWEVLWRAIAERFKTVAIELNTS